MTSDQIALVTGTSVGIGAALVAELLARRWTVIGVARRKAAVQHAAYTHVQLDLTDQSALLSCMNQEVASRLADRRWARVGLVNNAASAASLGPLPGVGLEQLQSIYAVTAIAPIWLMGFVTRTVNPAAALRIVNVSSGAATAPFPGLSAYCGSKSALRMAGRVLAAEWESGAAGQPLPADGAILSYEPGIVDTDMQRTARGHSIEEFPWVGVFRDFEAKGLLQAPEAPAREVADFLDSDRQPRFAERRLGGQG